MTSIHEISAEAVRALPSVQVVDCRFRLGQHGAGLELYREGHIAGALYLDLDDDLSGPMRDDRLGGRHPLPERGAFEQSLQGAGLCSDARIVVYDDGTGGAARAWWLLRHHGLASQVLEGGIAAWGELLAVGDPDVVPGDLVLGTERTDDLVDAAGVQAALAAGRIVLDARAPERYRGEVEPMDPVAGHIVGARNAPFNAPDAIDDDVLAAQEPPVVYCGSGVTAAALALRLAMLGREDTQVYAGSWSDWCARGLAEPAA
ncbi:MAG: sulfurtransferase [Thermoleophilia bacterium]|nr:sulfurtransferase [Thermoleophilia bacterium]